MSVADDLPFNDSSKATKYPLTPIDGQTSTILHTKTECQKQYVRYLWLQQKRHNTGTGR